MRAKHLQWCPADPKYFINVCCYFHLYTCAIICLYPRIGLEAQKTKNVHFRHLCILQNALQKAYTDGLSISLKIVILAWQIGDLETLCSLTKLVTPTWCTLWVSGNGETPVQGHRGKGHKEFYTQLKYPPKNESETKPFPKETETERINYLHKRNTKQTNLGRKKEMPHG